MTMTTGADLEMLRTRMAAAIGARMAGHIERLGWSTEQLAGEQRTRLRALLARAIERSPFHAARLAGIDAGRFELADLALLPVMTKAQMMESFDAVVTDRRLTRDLVGQHFAASAAEPPARSVAIPTSVASGFALATIAWCARCAFYTTLQS